MRKSLPVLQFISIMYLILSTYQLFAQEKLIGVTSGTSYTSYLNGTVFSIGTGGGSFIVHKKFYDAGFSPKGDLVRGTDGNFYGMTEKGGKNNAGVIFKMS